MPGPEFVMPPEEVAPPPVAPTASDAPPDAQRSMRPDAERAPADRRGRTPWRHILIGALVGVVVGAALLSGLAAADRAAKEAEFESLRSTAMAYLTAIADGDAALATAMVPATGAGEIAPDAALRAAAPIEGPEVRLIEIDGDAAHIDVRFALGSRLLTRTLDARRVDGEWRLRATLAEPVTVHVGDAPSDVTVGGVALRPASMTLLYPGRYELDLNETGLLLTGGDPFEVDGDPATVTEIFMSVMPTGELAAAAAEVARARVGACQLLAECPIDASTLPRPSDAIHVADVGAGGGAIDLLLPLGLGSGYGGSGEELRLRALVDATGSITRWECSDPSAPDGALQPCGP